MTELGAILERLGLDQYLDALVGEGFDTWETVLDIQESDLDALNVKLGHRRKLQREISNYRGIPYERLIGSPAYETSSEAGRGSEHSQSLSQQGDKSAPATGETKRKYRRHPKPDENAPDKPPSAYVIFSNKIREEIKGENLSFTVIAKLVGDRWQKLEPSEKEPYEAQAAAAKERYNIQLSAYKKTEAYKDYMEYLTDFKAKHADRPESKKPKLEKESSGGSISAKSGEMTDLNPSHRRVGSIGSMSSASYANSFPSPSGLPVTFDRTTSQVLRKSAVAGTSSQTESSPSSQLLGGSAKLRSAISTQSSTSDDSWASRGDHEAIQRTASLSLATAPTVYQALASLPTLETSSSDDSMRLASRRTYLPGHRDALPSMNPDPGLYQQYRGSPASTMAIAPADERWRTVLPDTASRPLPELPRMLNPLLPTTQTGSFGTAQLPPLMPPERVTDTTPDLLQRTLPPPRLSPHDQARGVPGFSRGSDSPAHAGTPTAGGAVINAPRLDRSESEAVDALAGLAATGGRGDVAEQQDLGPKRR